MRDEKKDRRVRRTQKQLEDALFELLKTKSVNQISVRELADAADITRATFYTHYRDAYDMLTHLQEKILSNILIFIQETTGKDPERFFLKLFSYLKNDVLHPEVLFYNTGDGSAFERIGSNIRENYMLQWTKWEDEKGMKDYEYYRSYTIFGCIAVIQKWISNGMRETPEYMTALALGFLPQVKMHPST